MIERLLDFLLDPAHFIVLAATVSAFLTVLGFALPYLEPDTLGRRLRLAARRRHELRAQQMEALQQKSRLRRNQPSRIRTLVERLKLRELFAGEELKTKLIQANWRDPNAVAVFAAARALTPVVLAALAVLVLFGSGKYHMAPTMKVAIVFLAVVIGVYMPNIMMTNAIQKRQESLTRGFPDALDLLLICVESGLSMEAAFGRVAKEIGESYPELAEEFELTTAELAYLPDRRAALENLSLRTGLGNIKAVTTTLIQAEKYGTPLTAALRNAAQENRDTRLALAEKKAASLPAILTVPMILFFLPALFVVILGPAIIQLMR
jgi:tight adherence protein C